MKTAVKNFLTVALFAIALVGHPMLRAQPNSTIELHGVHVHPSVVVEGQPFVVTVTGFNIGRTGEVRADPSSYTVETDGDQIVIVYTSPDSSTCISPTPPLPPSAPQRRIFDMPGLNAGSYTLRVEYSIDYNCSRGTLTAATGLQVYAADTSSRLFFHETPAQGQTVSGVGLIRGWACYREERAYGEGEGPVIGALAYRIDNGPLRSLAYGAIREDTAQVCGQYNLNTGYGAVVYWGNFGAGGHVFKLYLEGEEVASTTFTVVVPDGGFFKGLEGQYQLNDFPDEGSSVNVEWSEADQNFIIVDFD